MIVSRACVQRQPRQRMSEHAEVDACRRFTAAGARRDSGAAVGKAGLIASASNIPVFNTRENGGLPGIPHPPSARAKVLRRYRLQPVQRFRLTVSSDRGERLMIILCPAEASK